MLARRRDSLASGPSADGPCAEERYAVQPADVVEPKHRHVKHDEFSRHVGEGLGLTAIPKRLRQLLPVLSADIPSTHAAFHHPAAATDPEARGGESKRQCLGQREARLGQQLAIQQVGRAAALPALLLKVRATPRQPFGG